MNGPRMKQRAALLDAAGDYVDAVPLQRPLPSSIVHLGRVFCLDEGCASLEAREHDELPLLIYREEPL